MLVAGIIIGVLLLIVIVSYAMIRFYPAFGGVPKRFESDADISEHYQNGKFMNQLPTKTMDHSLGGMYSLFSDHLKSRGKRRPKQPLPIIPLEPAEWQRQEASLVSWFGHSAVLLKLDGKTLLLDPMLGTASSPFSWFGSKRYAPPPIHPEDLPRLDAVLFSHDHYDHLDYGTVKKMDGKVAMYFVPLGVGARLLRFGVPQERIRELDWNEEAEWKGLRLVCTPARHFSGRAVGDQNATLWGSWVIIGDKEKIFYSGDSGYGPHFKKIGESYGPFDLAIIECGQYDRRWADIHMVPEQTAQAFQDVRAKRLLPVHWAGFTLALHGWAEPVERLLLEAEKRQIKVMTPKIGELASVGAESDPEEKWWRKEL